ncbi:LOW QUALITY PROTEIN: hypothetical protein U9M48_002112 [Paspalum notatum var. saurae]|uniref:Reverse transcriptase domain-containing protein n=1 Tax=Paspalum notatum var. saurae TaxID=547442 RepID=A0AAQ3PJ96_PASNO
MNESHTEDIQQVSLEENQSLTTKFSEKEFSEKEVRDAIFGMKPNKAPGRDGFPAEFNQEFWELIKKDILAMFDEFHNGCLPLHNLNFGTITLLPKAKEVKQIQQYRPICLLNVSFKVFTKVLANRTNAVANKIVSPSQTGFMSSRNILEGVVILHETLHELRKKKLNRVVLKLDFEKAYDKVDWDFLQQTLWVKGFSNRWCDWIKKVVSKGNVNVKVNDDLGHYFQTKKGVRQGDPLSPFLFNLIADMLATLITRGKANGQFRGVIPHLVEGGLSILQYADDTILFLEYDLAETVNLKLVLSVFKKLSGLKINFHKSEIFFLERQNYIRKNTYIYLDGVFPFKYLGIPMHYRKIQNKDWVEIEERFQKKLGSWKGKLLSVGGRLVLINSVLSSLPMFMFSFFEAPKGVIKKLDYYRSRFFWQSDEHKKKYRLAKWSSLMLPKCFGGIGILDLELQNKCLLSKWLYKLLNEDGAWQELIKKKYLHHKSITQVRLSILVGFDGVRNQFLSFGSFRTQNGRCVRFWEDKWNGRRAFMDLFPNLYRIVRKKHVTVASVLNSVPLNISFRRTLIGDNLVSWYELVLKVANISLAKGNNEFRWDLNKGGAYSVQFLYNVLIQDRSIPRNSKLWKLKIPLKIKIFLWYLKNRVILTKDNLVKRKWKGDTKSWLNVYSKKLKFHILLGASAICWAIWLWRNDMVIYRATYWIRCWSVLCKEEERGKLKLGCQHLESVVLKLFFNFGWQRTGCFCCPSLPRRKRRHGRGREPLLLLPGDGEKRTREAAPMGRWPAAMVPARLLASRSGGKRQGRECGDGGIWGRKERK